MDLVEKYCFKKTKLGSPTSNTSFPVLMNLHRAISLPNKPLPNPHFINAASPIPYSHQIISRSNTETHTASFAELSLHNEIKQIIVTTLPLLLTYICEWIPVYISYIMIGHLPNSAALLSGTGLAKVYSNITGLSIVWGLTSALYTYVPQAVKAQNNNLLRIYIQRAFWITTIVSFASLILQCFCGDILIAIGQPKELQSIIAISCYLFIPNIYFKCWLSILRRLAQSLDYRTQSMVASLIFAVLSYPFTYFLVHVLCVGFMAIPLVICSYTFMNLCATVFILMHSGHLKHLNLFKFVRLSVIFDKQSIIQYMKLALPGIVMNSFEWWMYEIVLLLAGYIKDEPQIAVAVLIISNSIHMVSCLIGGSIGTALNIRVGIFIGEKNKNGAKQSIKAGRIVVVGTAVVVFIIFLVCHSKIPYVFTNNPDIVNVITYIMYLIMVKQFFVILLQSTNGIFRAIGEPKFAAKVMFTCYYVISLPFMLIFLFLFRYDSNLFLGTIIIFAMLTLANIMASLFMQLYFIFIVDWKAILIKAQKRLHTKIAPTVSDEIESSQHVHNKLLPKQNLSINNGYGSINNDFKIQHLYKTQSA